MKTVLYMHGGSGNHGCEALVRTTTRLVKEYTNSEVVLWSTGKNEDVKYGVGAVTDKILSTEEMSHNTPGFLVSYFKFKFLHKKEAMYDYFVKTLFKESCAISIGGDNYCYTWSARDGAKVNRKIRKVCKKNVFWGCSIEEEFMTDEIVADLKGFDLITVREPLSYAVLKNHGIEAVQVADPAFLLEKKELDLPDGFIENNTVGINVSPLINDYESEDNIALDNYINLINYIIDETDMNICLIPHVVWSYNDDFKPINMLYKKFKDTSRVIKLGDYNCEELKGFISRCRFFVGARTHATIAAYSTCVPTLVVGYSIKSKGIARDLFGSYENYVTSVQNMKSTDDLVNAFRFIQKNEDEIKLRLTKAIPEYKEKSKLAGEKLKEIIGVK